MTLYYRKVVVRYEAKVPFGKYINLTLEPSKGDVSATIVHRNM